MAIQVAPIAPALPTTTAIQDPAARRFAQAVSEAIRAGQSAEGAVQSLSRAASAMSARGGSTPQSIADWLFSSELYQKLTKAIDKIDVAAKQAIVAEAVERVNAIASEASARATELANEATQRALEFTNEATTRAAEIAAEAQARVDGLLAEASAREAAIAAEAQARILAVQNEATTRAAEILAEQNARAQALLDEAAARGTAITNEATLRQQGDDQLAQTITTVSATVDSNTAAISAEATTRATEDAALAEQIEIVAATADAVRAATAAMIVTETQARASEDEALATQITTLTATVDSNTAAIVAEQTARATADTAESASRETLAAQLRGNYTGTDINAVASGLFYQERLARATADESLSQQITLLSAGAGEQFDYAQIWYFDADAEAWTGNGTPTASSGWLRPADHATDPYVDSPAGIGADGAKYGQVRLRVRKTGAPTWEGYLWWRGTGDSTWDAARRIALTEPTYDSNGIGLITVSPGWTGTIDRIRVDLSAAQAAGSEFAIDWVALGRPAPGASTAALLDEQMARASADTAEASARQALSSSLVGADDPTGKTLANLTSGLLYEERVARSTQDSALSSSITSLQATVTSNNNTLNAAITSEATARANADSSLSSQINTVSATAGGKNKVFFQSAEPTATTTNDLWVKTSDNNRLYRWDGTAWTAADDARIAANVAAIVSEQTARADADATLTSSLNALTATVDTDRTNAQTLVSNEAATRASADAAEASARQSLSSKLTGTADPSGATLANLTSGLLYDERVARSDADGALTTQLTTLQATVTTNYSTLDAAIASEQTARTDADDALASDITALTATVTTDRATTQALVGSEASARSAEDEALAEAISIVTATSDAVRAAAAAMVVAETTARFEQDEAVATQITALTVSLDANSAAITSESEARASADTALTTQVNTLSATVDANSAAIVSEASARAAQDEALATQITGLTATVNSNTAAISSEATARADADSSLTTQINTVSSVANGRNRTFRQTSAPTGANSGDVWYDSDANNKIYRYDGSSWVASDDGRIATNEAALVTETNTRTTNDSALMQAINTAWALTGTTQAVSQSGQNLITNWTAAQADKWSQLEAQVFSADGKTIRAALAEEATTRANADGSLYAQWTVKVDVDGYVAGFGLASESSTAGEATSSFVIRADKFAMVMPGYGEYVPFAIGPSGMTLNASLKTGVGANLLYNAGMSLSYDGYFSYGGSAGLNLTGWCLADEGAKYGTFYLGASTSDAGAFYIDSPNRVAVVPGQRYEVHAYTGAHRCDVGVYIDFWDANNNSLGAGESITYLESGGTNAASHGGGTQLSGYKRIGYFCTAPANAATARFVAYKTATYAGQTSSYMFVTMPFLGEAGDAQTEPSTWSEGSSALNTKLTSDNITVYMANATIGNAQIGGDIWSSNYSSGAAGWIVQRNGYAEFSNVKVRGDVQATSLNAATGTFSGTLTASAMNAVDTINLAGNAVTVPVSAYTAGSVALGNSAVTVQSAYIDAQGGTVVISGGCTLVNESADWPLDARWEIRAPDNAVIASGDATVGQRLSTSISFSCSSTQVGTYALRITAASGSGYAKQRSLVLHGAKR